MKKVNFLLWLCACLLSFSACRITVSGVSFNVNGNSIKGSGNIVTEERAVAAFTRIEASRGVNVIIEDGESDWLEVCTDDNLIPYIQTEISNGTLFVSLQDGISIRNTEGLNIYVKMEDIESLKATSGADILGTTHFTVGDIKIETTSAGDVKMQLTAQNIYVSATSGSDITLKGKAETLNGNLTSGADLTASDLLVRSCGISLTSGSDASIHVSEALSYSVTSGADLKCKGHPRIAESHVSSGGDVVFN